MLSKSYPDQYLVTYGIDASKTKRSKHRSSIWKEFELIYDANLIVQANALTIWISTN
jgi:hypothetical protein